MHHGSVRTLMGAAGAAHPPAGTFETLEALEPRRLLTTYQYTPVAEAFDLERLVRDVPALNMGTEGLGAGLVALGDVDGDGADDFAVSAPGSRGLGLSDPWTVMGGPGRVFIFSGRTGTPIHSLTDHRPGFGASLAALGDVNGDGVTDLAVGSPMYPGGEMEELARAGRVWVYSGADGTVIRTLNGAAAGDDFGWAVAGAGDVDGDGVGDMIVGAPGAGGTGRAFVYSGADGSVIHTLEGEAAGDRFGFAVSGGIDVPVGEGENEDDGVPEFLVGAPGHDVEGVGVDAGRAYAYDGAAGTVRFTFSGEAEGDQFGHAVLMTGNSRINRDFVFRWVVGVPGFDSPLYNDDFQQIGTALDGGRVVMFTALGFASGSDPAFLFGTEDVARFGSELFTIGDISRFHEFDEMEEWGATAPGAEDPADRLVVFNGNPTNAFVFPDFTAVEGAERVVLAGDVDGDGIRDMVAVMPPAAGAGTPTLRIVPVTLGAEQPLVVAASESGRYAVLQTTRNLPGASLVGYLSVDGALTPLTRVAGLLPGDNILAINDLGLIFGTVEATDSGVTHPPGALDRFFFVFNGERRLLSEVIGTVQGGPAPATVSFVAMSNAGDVIFNGGSPTQSGAWLYRGGVLRFLWNGVAGGVNDAGVVVGTTNLVFSGAPPIGPQGTGIALMADGTVVELPQLLNATAVNDRGEIVGTSAATRGLAVLHDGVLTDHGVPEGVSAASAVWVASDIDETGRMVAVVTWQGAGTPGGRPPSTNPAREYVFEPGVGLRLLRDAVVGDAEQDQEFVQTGVRWITDLNRLVAPAAVMVPGALAEPVDAAGSPNSASAGVGGVYVSAVNQDGAGVILRLSGVGVEAQGVTWVVDVSEVVTYTDARDGRVYAAARAGVDLRWFVQNGDGVFEDRGALPLDAGAQFAGPLTTFTSADGRVHIVGRLASGGDVAIVYQSNLLAPDSIANWQYANLSLLHFRAQGVEAPAITGPLTAYATRWGGMNIAGLDEDGDIQVMWWAPGLTFWTANNLSEIAGTPALEGRITAMVLPWDGITLTGVAAGDGDGAGELWSTWWAPALGGEWRADSLSEAAGSEVRFDPDSITSYVTAWGGQNIAGRDAQTGEIAVYWWAPATDVWVAEAISVESTPLTAGPLVSLADGGTLNLFTRAASAIPEEVGDIVRLFWMPDGLGWRVENLTELVRA